MSSAAKLEKLTELNSAVRKVDLKTVSNLLKSNSFKSLINEQNNHGMTPLHELSVRGTLTEDEAYNMAKLLLDNGAAPSLSKKDDEGYQPIHYAAHNGYFKVVKIFVENGASVTEITNLKQTVLHCAGSSGNLELVKYLISTNKCDLSAQNEFTATPADFAFNHGYPEISQYLTTQSK